MDIQQWANSVWDASSTNAEICEQALTELTGKIKAAEKQRVEDEGGWPARRGWVGAKALDMWYKAEHQWRKANKDTPVAWQYTGTDSGEEESEEGEVVGDDSDDDDAGDDDEDEVRPPGGRRRRRAPPHPRRSRPLNPRAMTRMRNIFLRTMNLLRK